MPSDPARRQRSAGGLEGHRLSIPGGGSEWQTLPETTEWQESRVLNRPIVLASKEEQLDCRRADGRACSEPDLPGTELLDAEAAKIVQDAQWPARTGLAGELWSR